MVLLRDLKNWMAHSGIRAVSPPSIEFGQRTRFADFETADRILRSPRQAAWKHQIARLLRPVLKNKNRQSV